jgi:hypothetical protein
MKSKVKCNLYTVIASCKQGERMMMLLLLLLILRRRLMMSMMSPACQLTKLSAYCASRYHYYLLNLRDCAAMTTDYDETTKINKTKSPNKIENSIDGDQMMIMIIY